jgi:hypothetical protein
MVDDDGGDDEKARRGGGGGGKGWVVWAATAAAPRCPVAQRITTTETRDDRHISSAASTVVRERERVSTQVCRVERERLLQPHALQF